MSFAKAAENVQQQIPGASEPQDKKSQTYSEWAKKTYNDKYETWMPWIEDQYLRWFGRGDNKASYATKGIPIYTPTISRALKLIHPSSFRQPFQDKGHWNRPSRPSPR